MSEHWLADPDKIEKAKQNIVDAQNEVGKLPKEEGALKVQLA